MKNKGISICITSAKGGVGKTLNTINLAGIYASLEKKVLIIDFDLYSGAIATSLNIEQTKSIYNFVDDYNNNRYKEFSNYICHYNDYIDVLASPKDPRQASKIDLKYIEIILDKAVFNYDIVLIDTPHILSNEKVLIMDLVDEILLVLTNDILDLKNMRSLVAILKDVNYTNYKVLLNESTSPFKKYFSLYDIKNIIKTNIDYVLTKDFYIKNLDSVLLSGNILTLDKHAINLFGKDYTTLTQIVMDSFKEKQL